MTTEEAAEFTQLAKRWRSDANQYQKQVEEARNAGTPYDQMLSMMTALRCCAAELDRVNNPTLANQLP